MMPDTQLDLANSPLGTIPEGWQVIQLKRVTTKIGSGATPRGGQEVYLPTRQNFALLRSQNVFDRHFETDGLAFITDEHAKDLAGAAVQAGDVLLNITGDGVTFARACLAPVDVFPACVNQHVAIIRADRSKLDPGYLLSYLTHPIIKGYIESFNAGGSRRAITKGHIESFEVSLPPLSEQRAIAHILGTLDDKIELNRRMNETLEAMAQALFQSWFVDFDPVRAKAEGCQPVGMDADTAALFPSAFQESSLGNLPEGWFVTKAGSLFTISRESINPGTWPEEVFDHYSIPAYDEGRVPTIEAGAAIRSNKFIVPEDAVLVSKLNPHIPRVWLPLLSGEHRSICSTEFLVTHANGATSVQYLYGLFNSSAFQEVFCTLVTGTSGSHQRVQPDHVLLMDMVEPSEQVIVAYTNIVRPLHGLVNHNLQESLNLAAIRDALLPKLLSGEIRVQDAEQIVSAAL